MVNTKSLAFELCVLQTVADLEIQKKKGFRYAYSLWSTKQQHEHTHFFSTHTSKCFKCPGQLRLTVELGPNNTLDVLNLSNQ